MHLDQEDKIEILIGFVIGAITGSILGVIAGYEIIMRFLIR